MARINLNEMKKIRFGIEIETGGNTRKNTAKIIADYFGTEVGYEGTGYDTYTAKDSNGRTWRVMRDSSVNGMGMQACEIVSPLLSYEDIEDLQEIIRKLRAAGNKADNSCGIHIHIDNSTLNCHDILGIANFVSSKQDIIYKAIGCSEQRKWNWCKPIDKDFVDVINNNRRTLTPEKLRRYWYENCGGGYENNWNGHYNSSRYHLLNLHSMFTGKGIEFRCFNGTMHAGKIKAYIQFCLAITEYCKEARCISPIYTECGNDTLNNWFLKVGLGGDEFATMRHHLKVNFNAQEVA